jgi:hypothetical protein
MVALNFQTRFAEDVEYGKKRQTIRKTARCKPGTLLQLYTGMRTKNCRLLGKAICTRVTPVEICATGMFLNGKRLYAGHAYRGDIENYDSDFAQKDGFGDFMEMAEWFHNRYGELPFEGFVIEWDEPR